MTVAGSQVKQWMALIALAMACACTSDAEPSAEENAPPAAADTTPARPDTATAAPDTTTASTVHLIDPNISQAVAGAEGWNYHRSAEADLDGDGRPEKIVLAARVELYRGRPAWDDGQPWAVYVEARDGTRTYVYTQRLQLGSLTMRVTRGDGALPTIILLEHLPDRMSVYEASYAGPGQITVANRFQRDLDPRGETASPLLP